MPGDRRGDGDWSAMLRDMRAMIVALTGLVVVVLVVLIALGSLPGPVAQGQLDTKTPAVQAIAATAVTAVASIVAAYFGIRAAGAARDSANTRARTRTTCSTG
jgi:protein-S-isoprenylcysteine O-methyltransferase Ste14